MGACARACASVCAYVYASVGGTCMCVCVYSGVIVCVYVYVHACMRALALVYVCVCVGGGGARTRTHACKLYLTYIFSPPPQLGHNCKTNTVPSWKPMYDGTKVLQESNIISHNLNKGLFMCSRKSEWLT